MPLFSPVQLQNLLHYEVHEDWAAAAEQVAAGWLSGATSITTWPEPLPSALAGWALELGGIAYENPTSMRSDGSGDTESAWYDRRSQILAQAERWADQHPEYRAAAAGGPLGTFPPPPRFPGTNWR